MFPGIGGLGGLLGGGGGGGQSMGLGFPGSSDMMGAMNLNFTRLAHATGKGAVEGNPGMGQMVDLGNGYVAYAPNAKGHRLAGVLMGALEKTSDNLAEQMGESQQEARQSRFLDQKFQNQMALNEQNYNFARALNGGAATVAPTTAGGGGGTLALPQGDTAAWQQAGMDALNSIRARSAAAPVPPIPSVEMPATGSGIWNGYTTGQRALRTGGLLY